MLPLREPAQRGNYPIHLTNNYPIFITLQPCVVLILLKGEPSNNYLFHFSRYRVTLEKFQYPIYDTCIYNIRSSIIKIALALSHVYFICLPLRCTFALWEQKYYKYICDSKHDIWPCTVSSGNLWVSITIYKKLLMSHGIEYASPYSWKIVPQMLHEFCRMTVGKYDSDIISTYLLQGRICKCLQAPLLILQAYVVWINSDRGLK